MIPDLLSAFPHRQFHTLPGLLDSWAALPNSNPNAIYVHDLYTGILSSLQLNTDNWVTATLGLYGDELVLTVALGLKFRQLSSWNAL